MQVEFRRDIRNQYIVIRNRFKDEGKPDYRFSMITGNKIPSLALCHAEQMDSDMLMYYDITGEVSIEQHLKNRAADAPFFKALFSNLSNALESVQEYLLDADDLLLEPGYVFTDQSLSRMDFIYYPDNQRGFAAGCRALSEGILNAIKQDDIDAVRLGYGFYKSCASGDITVQLLSDMAGGGMSRNLNEPEAKEVKEVIEKNEAVESADEDYSFLFAEDKGGKKKREGAFGKGFIKKVFKVKEKNKKFKQEDIKDNPDAKIINKPETATKESVDLIWYKDINQSEERQSAETVFLGADERMKEVKAWLMPQQSTSGEGIMLVNDRYIVGKRIAGADIAFDSRAVSRAHAKLIWKQGLYYIMDLSSKNGTRVNGEKLEDGEKRCLKDGDSIVFADTGCVYKQLLNDSVV